MAKPERHAHTWARDKRHQRWCGAAERSTAASSPARNEMKELKIDTGFPMSTYLLLVITLTGRLGRVDTVVGASMCVSHDQKQSQTFSGT